MGTNPQVVVNEIAPRPHNSGHYTIEACYTSQFENHVRAVLGLPLGACDMKVWMTCDAGVLPHWQWFPSTAGASHRIASQVGAAVMVNVLGQGSSLEDTWAPFARALSVDGAGLHWCVGATLLFVLCGPCGVSRGLL
jgi:phosphoribosylaminoimidazole carboxylase (NCAIR synthetase)